MRARLRVAIALVALVALALPALASAHARLESTTPRAGSQVGEQPARIALSFGTPVEEAFLQVTVEAPHDIPRPVPAVRAPGDEALVTVPSVGTAIGVHAVRWRAFSKDGHASSGAFTYAVDGGLDVRYRMPAGEESLDDHGPLQVLARFLVLLGPVLVLGLVVTRAWVVERGLGVTGAGEPWGDAVAGATRGWWAAFLAGLGAWIAGLVLGPIATLGALGAGAGDLATLLDETRWGIAWWAQAIALVVTVAIVLAMRPRRTPLGDAMGVALAAPAGVALVSMSWAGHASGGNDRAINIGGDALHALATGAWIGGLVALLVLLVPALRALGGADRVRLAASSIVRFSTLGVASVAVLVVTGVYRALAEVPSFSDLTGTSYGVTLLVKLGIFALMLIAGAYNRFVIHPRLERAAMGLDPTDRGATDRIRASVVAEVVLGAGVLVAVAVLVSLPPP